MKEWMVRMISDYLGLRRVCHLPAVGTRVSHWTSPGLTFLWEGENQAYLAGLLANLWEAILRVQTEITVHILNVICCCFSIILILAFAVSITVTFTQEKYINICPRKVDEMAIMSHLTVIAQVLVLESIVCPFLQPTWGTKKENKGAAGQFLSNSFG